MPKVLIVDDIEENLYYLRTLLAAKGYQVEEAKNGAEALAQARPKPPDLIIADILMPVMDGFALCRAWRSDPQLADLPFVFYTGTYTDSKDEELALNLGADLFLVKPMEPSLLMEAIQGVLHRHRAHELVRRQVVPDQGPALLRDYNAALIRKLEDKVSELDASEQRLRSYLDAASQGILGVTADGKIEMVNRTLELMFGFDRSELIGQAMEILLPERFRANHVQHRAAFFSNPRMRIMGSALELVGRRKDGTEFPIEVSLSFVQKEGMALGLVSDVSERRHAEQEKKLLDERLFEAQKLQSIGVLAGGVAHDFNNFLTIIHGSANRLIRQSSPTDPIRQIADQITTAANRAGLLIRQLLAFSRKQVLQKQLLNLNHVLNALKEMLRSLVGEQIEAIVMLDPELNCISADPSQLEQVIINMAVNSRDAITDGGKVVFRTENIEINKPHPYQEGEIPPGRYVRLTVKDTGIGMSPETLGRIFEPFFTTKDPAQGTGLGLSTVYGIVKQCEGHIDVESEVGRGTTFRIYFPGAEGRTNEPSVGEQLAATGVHGSETILLVEDNDALRELVEEMLAGYGYTVLSASGAVEVEDLMNKTREIDILVTDVRLPGINGRDLAERIGRKRPALKVLYMSGYSEEIFRDEWLDSKTFFIQKPFTPSALVAKVREILDAQPQAQ